MLRFSFCLTDIPDLGLVTLEPVPFTDEDSELLVTVLVNPISGHLR